MARHLHLVGMKALLGSVIAIMAFAVVCALPAFALADDIELTEYFIQNSSSDEARATHCPETCAHFAELCFSKNVSYYPVEGDRSAAQDFIQGNVGCVHLQKADGTEVIEALPYMYRTEEYETGEIYVDFDGWLEPDAEYQLVIDAGLKTWEGDSVSANPYVIKFRTNDQLPIGIGLHALLFSVFVAIVLSAGVVVAWHRRKKENGRRHPREAPSR